MYLDEDIQSAVETGILTHDNAIAFREHVAQSRGTAIADDEHFRLVTGFNDIFVSIACLLFLVSLAWIGTTTVTPWFGAILCVIATWGLAEYFTRKRGMALPSIVLLLGFIGTVLATAGFLLVGPFDNLLLQNDFVGTRNDARTVTLCVATGIAAIAALLHWRRFKVPITVAAGTATAVACVITLFAAVLPEESLWWMNIITFCGGLAVFVLAIRWDMSDRHRRTRRSDVGFWLHLVAAPLLVHPIFSYLDVFDSYITGWQAGGVLFLYVLIAIVSIVVDRRALMISALIYVVYAFTVLLEASGIGLSFALTGLTISSGLLLLTVFWHSCRKAVIKLVPQLVQELLPPVRIF